MKIGNTTYTVEYIERAMFDVAVEDGDGNTPTTWAITQALIALQNEMSFIEDGRENGQMKGLTKRHIEAFKKINNKLVDDYSKIDGGDASAYYMDLDS